MTWYVVRNAEGVAVGRVFALDDDALQNNTPEGCTSQWEKPEFELPRVPNSKTDRNTTTSG